MSDARTTRMPMIAVGLALVAVIVSLVAGVSVLTRGDGRDGPGTSSSVLLDHRIAASDVVKLREQIEIVTEAGLPRGVRVKDTALARAVGLQADDVITALSGRAVTREADLAEVILRASSLRATTLYAEVERGGTRVLLRWQLDGNLRDAQRDALAQQIAGTGSGTLGSLPATPTLPANPFVTDPAFDTIVKVDDLHYTMPRKTLLAVLADPSALMRGARVVPMMANGQADGFKLFAIRPDSPYARLDLQNGDTFHTVNGHQLAEVDDMLMFFGSFKNASALTLELTRRGKPVTLLIEITK